MTARVAVFATGRADLYPLAPVLRALSGDDDMAVTLLASGTTGNPAFGEPLADLDLAEVDVVSVVDDLDRSAFADQAAGGARIAAAVAEVLEQLRPAACVVLGDRWELLYAVPPMVLAGVPIVHLHGGEVTAGAVDERVRHAVTKLADLHCVSTAAAAERVRQLGEPAERIVITGAPGLDSVREVRPADDKHLARVLGEPVRRPLALVTYHPPTASDVEPGTAAREVLSAVAESVGSAVITHPGLDRCREEVVAAIRAAVARSPHLHDVPTLGGDYLPVMAAVDVVVGNSSSGIIEAASFGIPVVDVGDRQRGRVRGPNVVHAAEERTAVAAAIRRCLEPEFRDVAERADNPYGDGRSAGRIVEVVRRAVESGTAHKVLVDLDGEPLR